MTGLTPGTVYYVEILSMTAGGETVRRTLNEPARAPAAPSAQAPPPLPPGPPPKPNHYSEIPHFTAYFGGGFTLPQGTAGDRFTTGGNFMGGAGPRFGFFSLPVDFGYNRMALMVASSESAINALNPPAIPEPKSRRAASEPIATTPFICSSGAA